MWLLTIDPGKRSLAWALWCVWHLVDCGLVKSGKGQDPWELYLELLVIAIARQVQEHTESIDRVVVELPRIYPQDRNKRPNDLIDLAAAAGACSSLGPLRFVHPQQWKGQLPKRISNQRTIDALTPEEVTVLGRYAKNHNVLDAVGIGLKEVGR